MYRVGLCWCAWFGGFGSLLHCGVDVCCGLGVGWARGVCFGIRVDGRMVPCVGREECDRVAFSMW